MGREPVARHEARPLLVERVQAKLPDPLKAVALAAQTSARYGSMPSPGIPSASDRDLVTDGQPLKLGQDWSRSAIEITEQPVEPVVAVQPAALIPHLHEPRPDVSGRASPSPPASPIRRIDAGAVARHDPAEIGRRGPPTPEPPPHREPVQHRQRERNEQDGNHGSPTLRSKHRSCPSDRRSQATAITPFLASITVTLREISRTGCGVSGSFRRPGHTGSASQCLVNRAHDWRGAYGAGIWCAFEGRQAIRARIRPLSHTASRTSWASSRRGSSRHSPSSPYKTYCLLGSRGHGGRRHPGHGRAVAAHRPRLFWSPRSPWLPRQAGPCGSHLQVLSRP